MDGPYNIFIEPFWVLSINLQLSYLNIFLLKLKLINVKCHCLAAKKRELLASTDFIKKQLD